MTKEQQLEVLQLKASGLSFGEIATKLGLSRNTVKSFYQRKHNTDEFKPKATCEQCGTPLFPKPGHRKPRFCSDKCRVTWWNSHQSQMTDSGMIEITCKTCGTLFRAYPSQNRSYCSKECSIKAHTLNPKPAKRISNESCNESIVTAPNVTAVSPISATTPTTQTSTGNDLDTPIICSSARTLNDNQFNFIASMGVFRKMLTDALITRQEYKDLDVKMKQKYGIPEHSILSDTVIKTKKSCRKTQPAKQKDGDE